MPSVPQHTACKLLLLHKPLPWAVYSLDTTGRGHNLGNVFKLKVDPKDNSIAAVPSFKKFFFAFRTTGRTFEICSVSFLSDSLILEFACHVGKGVCVAAMQNIFLQLHVSQPFLSAPYVTWIVIPCRVCLIFCRLWLRRTTPPKNEVKQSEMQENIQMANISKQ